MRLNKRIHTDLTSPITCISNIDSVNIAVGGQDGTVSVYSILNGRLVASHESHLDQVTCLTNFTHKNTNYVCSGAGGLDPRILIWDIKEKTPFLEFNAHQGSISCITTTGIERNIVSGSNDKC